MSNILMNLIRHNSTRVWLSFC